MRRGSIRAPHNVEGHLPRRKRSRESPRWRGSATHRATQPACAGFRVVHLGEGRPPAHRSADGFAPDVPQPPPPSRWRRPRLSPERPDGRHRSASARGVPPCPRSRLRQARREQGAARAARRLDEGQPREAVGGYELHLPASPEGACVAAPRLAHRPWLGRCVRRPLPSVSLTV